MHIGIHVHTYKCTLKTVRGSLISVPLLVAALGQGALGTWGEIAQWIIVLEMIKITK